MINHEQTPPDDFGDYRELTGEDHKNMIELIRLYRRQGVPAGMVFKPVFLGLRDDPDCLQIILKMWKDKNYRYSQSVFVFGWWPKLLVHAKSIAYPVVRIWDADIASHDAAEEFCDPDFLRELTHDECIARGRKLKVEEVSRDEAVYDILGTVEDPRNWHDTPPPSTVFLLGPVEREERP